MSFLLGSSKRKCDERQSESQRDEWFKSWPTLPSPYKSNSTKHQSTIFRPSPPVKHKVSNIQTNRYILIIICRVLRMFLIGFLFCHALHRFYLFSRRTSGSLVTCFPAFATGYKFPALSTDCVLSHACRRLHVFPRFALVTYFPALYAAYKFLSRVLIGLLHFFREQWLALCK